ncbi:MAG: OmpA family protein [Acidobacteria bacterium]|nr:OmpA family protein [Acidobacteriota bacterium]
MILFLGVSSAEEHEGMFSITPHVGGFHFDDNLDLDDGYVVGVGAGYNFTENLSFEFVLDVVDMDTESGGEDMSGYMFRFDGLYHFRPEERVVPYVAVGIGGMTFDPNIGDMETRLISNYGAGVKYYFMDNIGLRGDVRHLFIEDQSHINILYTMGVDILFGKEKAAPPPPPPPPDSDGDGVIDSEDKCPNTPRGVKVDRYGCPLDTDGDGVYDYLDKCPNTPRGVKVDSSGCPLDTDGDGVYDYLDKCPNTPRGVAVNSSGCPPDTDGDGVYDYLDKCPNTPRGVKVDSSGCPLDTDGDGVLDYLDKCPDTPRDLKVDDTGCPILMKEQVSIRLDIQFDTNKADIKPEYNDRLKEVADFMAKYPGTKAEIDGHTDSTGSATYNQKLSQRRAESVRDYLIQNFNISQNRLTAKGYGEEKPVASNDTIEGRSQNRRIEAVFSAEEEYYEKR